MISRWLPDLQRAEFDRDYFQRQPLARTASARDAVRFLTWRTVARLLDTARQPDMLIVRNGSLRRDSDPASFDQALSLFREGWSIVLRRCERHDPDLRDLAEAIAAEMEGDVSIQLYLTPAGFRSFGWHYDCEDVFIVQTGGAKEYYLRQNSVNPEPKIDAMPKDMQFERETSPAVASTLVAGDCLYVPRGWWHIARALDDSLSISVGVLSPAAGGTAREAPSA